MVENNKDILLYAPWRKKYILDKKVRDASKNSKTCVFCKPEKKLLILETSLSYIQANKYPYGVGHLLVIPKRHVNNIISLTSKERIDIFNLIDLSIFSLKKLLGAKGYNVGCSIGDIAGETISHLHFHVLPRFKGDSGWDRLCNFLVTTQSPLEVTNNLRKIIQKNKLKKKFDII